jgi:hypothetical protein
MDGGRIPVSQPKKRRRKRLRKHNGLASGGGVVLPPTSLLYLLPPMVHPPTPLAQALRRALVQLHRRPWLVARSASVAAALCSVRVWRIFRAINEFWGVVAAAITARVVGGARIRTRRVRVSNIGGGGQGVLM